MPAPDSEILLTVIIPAYLEEENIASTVLSLKKYFDGKDFRVEYLVIDDGSTDKTSENARDAGADVIRLNINQGKGAAVRMGMMKGTGKYLLFTDADYPYEIDAIEKCFTEFEKGADVVIGSRNLGESDRGKERFKRRAISKIGNLVARILILPGISDTQAGFKCFERNAAREIFPRTLIDGWGFDIEILYLAKMRGFKIAEVPIRLIPRAIRPSRLKNPTRTALNVLGSIFRVRLNSLLGRYR